MADADLLRDLRARVLDEGEPLAGLLRTCLALGAITRSEDLRRWATQELKGYGPDDKVPAYRELSLPLFVDSVSGYNFLKGQPISRFAAPPSARQFIPETISFRQPVEDLAAMNCSNRIGFEGLNFAVSVWNKALPFGQEIIQLYYMTSDSAMTGMLGTVRTTLLEMVLDMTQDVPLDQLPSRNQVDAAVQVHVHGGTRDQYNVNVGGANHGVIGQGVGSTQTQHNGTDLELQKNIAAIRAALEEVEDSDDRSAVAQSVDDFEEAVEEGDPETVRRRGGMLSRLAAGIGNVALTAAVSEGVQAAVGAFT
ncbi:AbiTii domain-containing protein [Nocardia gipuzkoensis]